MLQTFIILLLYAFWQYKDNKYPITGNYYLDIVYKLIIRR